MRIIPKTIELETKKEFDFIDLTDEVQKFLQESQIKNGFLNVQTLHTTAPLFLNENEPLLLEDFKNHLKRLFPKDLNYNHNDFSRRTLHMHENECRNAHSHCEAIHLPSNLTLNIIDNKLQLGKWQRIFLVELDQAKPRKVQLQIMGE
jgi:secondary thiamine-phosphate synthase enzyme